MCVSESVCVYYIHSFFCSTGILREAGGYIIGEAGNQQ